MYEKKESEPFRGVSGGREELADTVKGIAIFLVVTGHLTGRNEKVLTAFITACHMPAFFFVSGYFFRKSGSTCTAAEFFCKKAAALLVPYLCWSAVALLAGGGGYLARRDLTGFLKEATGIFVYARSVWFLLILFLTQMIYFLAEKALHGISGRKYLVIMLAWGVTVWLFSVWKASCSDICGTVFQWNKFEWLFPYFVAGDICGRHGIFRRQTAWCRQPVPATVLCAGLYIWLLAAFYHERAFFEFYGTFRLVPCHAGYYAVYYLNGCVGTLLLFLLARCLDMRGRNGRVMKKVSGMLRTAGYYSIDIYVQHMFPVKLFHAVFKNLSPDSASYYGVVLLYSLAVVTSVTAASKYLLRRCGLYRFGIGRR